MFTYAYVYIYSIYDTIYNTRYIDITVFVLPPWTAALRCWGLWKAFTTRSTRSTALPCRWVIE